ncbi:uncharacterized protein EDB91DRAFT_1256862 [Suillus paluster]|uniref:uncharacterized protein n=1 Tax=Suillus paluster TaxID=48578 RepID=UPI001B868391|nr:uncharacterized protein EDB91DRAFT_1256862 [Suillus paluster]KAG1720727.1 hypothetical protein EDB91DRAFT_1256862 [Suillus paluster]
MSNSLSSDDPDDQQDNLEDLDEVENTGKRHGTKKTKGTATNHRTYDLALGISGNTIDSVKLKATALLKKAMYLRSHPDAEGRASNFANVAVRIICHRSFYDNGSKSLKHFTKFQKTIPPPVLFLIGTIIRNMIYIYSKYGQVNGAKQTPIEDSETAYDHISTLFNHTNRDEYHGPKLHQMLKAWALEGI